MTRSRLTSPVCGSTFSAPKNFCRAAIVAAVLDPASSSPAADPGHPKSAVIESAAASFNLWFMIDLPVRSGAIALPSVVVSGGDVEDQVVGRRSEGSPRPHRYLVHPALRPIAYTALEDA